MADPAERDSPRHSLTSHASADTRARDRAAGAFARLLASAEAAEAVCRPLHRWFALGGCAIQLSFAGPALLPLARALRHLASPPAAEADLRMHVWDSGSTGVDAAPCAGGPASTALGLLAPGQPRAIYWMRDATALSAREASAPFREILHPWQQRVGHQFVHAGAVACGEDGVVLAGVSGSGKSTATLACLLGGLDYLGDDHVVLSDGPSPEIHSVYSAAKLHPHHCRMFPQLLPHIANPNALGAGKALWFVNEFAPERMRRAARARAMVVPRVSTGLVTRATPISPAAALLALAPSTIIQLRGAGGDALAWMANFVARLPCYQLDLGSDPVSIADTVRELIARS